MQLALVHFPTAYRIHSGGDDVHAMSALVSIDWALSKHLYSLNLVYIQSILVLLIDSAIEADLRLAITKSRERPRCHLVRRCQYLCKMYTTLQAVASRTHFTA